MSWRLKCVCDVIGDNNDGEDSYGYDNNNNNYNNSMSNETEISARSARLEARRSVVFGHNCGHPAGVVGEPNAIVANNIVGLNDGGDGDGFCGSR